MIDITTLKFDEKGLIPAIVVDAETNKVLTLAYMNEESLKISIEKKLTCFWSRSRQELWLKGETSGNYQHIVKIVADCDKDALTVYVKKEGPACHTGTDSCFNETVYQSSEMSEFSLQNLYDLLKERKETLPEGSYTTSLFQSGVNKMAQKVGEEAVETVIEACNGTDERLIYEGADLLYHLIVLLTSKGYRIEDLARELMERHSVTWKKH